MKPRDKAEAALNHEAMARDNAAAALRKRAEAAMKLERQGRHNDAIARVDDLAAKHSDSALVLHLAGHIHHAAARRAARAGDKESMANHIVTAHGHIDRAKRLVPNCIAISDLLARVLFLGLRHAEAERVARDAVSIASPVDPADNSALYAVRSNATRHRRVEDCRKAALDNLRTIERYFPDLVRKVLKLDANGNAQEALKKAKDLANSFPSSSRLQLLSAHMQLRRLRSLDPGMDRRPFLDHIRKGIEDAIAKSSGGSLVLALFHAKVCFVLGLYKTFSFECVRAFAMREPVDPKLEDVPPDSVQGDEFQDRVHSVHAELKCLLEKLFLVADDFRRSMASEKQDDFLSVRLVELQEYYDANFRNYKWDAQTTIADALSFVKNNRSWRFWVCPSCAGNELLADVHTLLEHMNSKHLPGLLSVFDDSQRSAEYVLLDGHLDQISVYQDSEGGHFFRFNKTESVFKILSLPSEELSFSALKEEKCIPGKEILEEIEDKLKLLPADKSNAEFDEARLKVLDLWLEFVKISMLDYRLIIMAFAKPFIWTELLQSLSEHKAASKISNDDIDVIFPCGEVHAEDKMGRSEIQPNSNIADDQSGVNSASNLLGTNSQRKSVLHTASISRMISTL